MGSTSIDWWYGYTIGKTNFDSTTWPVRFRAVAGKCAKTLSRTPLMAFQSWFSSMENYQWMMDDFIQPLFKNVETCWNQIHCLLQSISSFHNSITHSLGPSTFHPQSPLGPAVLHQWSLLHDPRGVAFHGAAPDASNSDEMRENDMFHIQINDRNSKYSGF